MTEMAETAGTAPLDLTAKASFRSAKNGLMTVLMIAAAIAVAVPLVEAFGVPPEMLRSRDLLG